MAVDQDASVRAHYSSLTAHRKCPQAWYYKYGLRITEPESRIAPERDFGSWWALLRSAETLERGRKLDSLKQEPRMLKAPSDEEFDMREMTRTDVLEAAKRWWSGHKNQPDGDGGFASEQWETKLGGELPDLLEKLLQRHTDRWADDLAHEHPLGVEVYWERELPQPKDSWVPEGYPTMNLIGYIDQLYWDDARGIVVARDDKTSKELGQSSAVADMMDSQLQLYAWGATPMVVGWGFKKGIKAVAYDRARSVAPKPPHLTKSGRLSVHKGEPSTGMMDLQTYLDWVETKPEYPGLKKDGSGAGVYEAEEKVIEKLKTPAARSVWFQRSQMPLNLNLVRSHLRAAVDSAYDQYLTEKRTKDALEAQRNLGMACRFCSYASLCRAQMIGGPEGRYDLPEHGLEGKKGEKVLEAGALV